ncbi:error-prone DNA polymerase [Rhodomicrobium vannielii ATCC 17100]|uniref:error-prone DNA polymerase n=1 Tax=Rhodomicrobium vannielii TaxID=1069 RepID=UPI00191B0DDB|nr:error-prone DNA polymerase [Rhodomicrobium vannielii]MBJ7535995.1 error-prone DNA polymerase [Rhodomicrobium vannielii ATCC 17100]
MNAGAVPRYAELQAATNFSFLEGASHPHELVARAAELGLSAVAITDRNSLAGVVRAHLAAREHGVKLVIGCRLSFVDRVPDLLCYPIDRAAYGRLCRLLTLGKSDRVIKCEARSAAAQASEQGPTKPLPVSERQTQAARSNVVSWPKRLPETSPSFPPATAENAASETAMTEGDAALRRAEPDTDASPLGHTDRDREDTIPKGECRLTLEDFLAFSEGQIVAVLPPDDIFRSPRRMADFQRHLKTLATRLPDRVYLAASHRFRGDDGQRIARLAAFADALHVPLVATGDVLYHTPARRRLQDVLTCIRHTCTIDAAGFRLVANAERHLKAPAEMARLFARYPEAVANTVKLAARCTFSLAELTYEYPEEIAPDGEAPQARLERLTWEGLAWRYSDGVPDTVAQQVRHEFELIARFDYAPFFLTVEDIVRFAREKNILHQGRGSAANSAVCYALGITGVDPARSNLLFERFISDARHEPPDIDVDFEHERREEVIQYIYSRFGRHRAGLCATVICYRTRGAVREVGKALGLSPDVTAALSGSVWGWSDGGVDPGDLASLGLDASDPRLMLCLELTRELIGFPRHLSQHPGGFLIARGRLDELAPIENAAMKDRTIVSWDKDDIEALGMLKVDVLALGMLTCLAKGFDLIRAHYGRDLTPATVPSEDPAVYAMLSRADSIGVFQVESRAQQTMLPRLKPQNFYDLVIEVAIVRPGPIQGDMVHPYLRRRQGLEEARFPSPELRGILEKTLGVPLFQEQCMRIAIVAAGFSAGRADELRRAMATFKKVGTIGTFKDEFIGGMLARNYPRDFAERCFSQIQGFGTYGFPESHAASFALLVYCSAWMKCHYPDVFAAAILNSQPMGFYAPAQLFRDAREHGVEVRAADVNASEWNHTLEAADGGRHALRLGFRLVAGMREDDAENIVEARAAAGAFRSTEDVMRRAKLGTAAMLTLARADAFGSVARGRRETLWDVAGLEADELPLFAHETAPSVPPSIPAAVALPPLGAGEAVAEDYSVFGLSLRNHPMAFMRAELQAQGMVRAVDLKTLPNGRFVTIAGLVLFRQRPGTAKGTIFMTIEDETGAANLIIWPKLSETYRRAVFGAKVILCEGVLQRESGVIHVVSRRLTDFTRVLGRLQPDADAFAVRYGRGDEVAHGTRAARRSSKVNEDWTRTLKSRDFR